MLLSSLFLTLPALVAQAPAPTPALTAIQELMEAIPEALIDGKPKAMRGLVAKAKAGWDQARPELRKAMPEPELLAIEMQLKGMGKMKPREMAVGALGISSTLSRFQPRSRQQDLLHADRTAMLVWCDVDAGNWVQLPHLAEAFQPLLDQDKGQHPAAVAGVQKALQAFQASLQKRQAAGAKKALKDLLDLVDVLEKP